MDTRISGRTRIHSEPVKVKDATAKMFFALSLVFGLFLSIYSPIFSEPDGQYHFDQASYLANVVVDCAKVDDNRYSQGKEFAALQEKRYVDQFYIRKENRIARDKVFDTRVINVSWTMRAKYIVPAIGVWVGYHIYPSIGVMVTVARIFNAVFYSIVLALLIKRLRQGKMFLGIVALSPAMTLVAYSLSYDNISFLVGALVFVESANFFIKKNYLGRWIIPKQIVMIMLLYIFGKGNSLVVAILPALIILYVIYQRVGFVNVAVHKIKQSRALLISSIGLVIIVGFAGLYVVMNASGGVNFIGIKILNTLISSTSQPLSIGSVIGNGNSGWQRLPIWVYGIWSIAYFVVLFTDDESTMPKWVAIIFAIPMLLNVFGMLVTYAQFSFAAFNGGGAQLNTDSPVDGLQGRYFAPFWIFTSYIATLFKTRLAINKQVLRNAVGILIVGTFVLQIFIMWYLAYHLHLIGGM